MPAAPGRCRMPQLRGLLHLELPVITAVTGGGDHWHFALNVFAMQHTLTPAAVPSPPCDPLVRAREDDAVAEDAGARDPKRGAISASA